MHIQEPGRNVLEGGVRAVQRDHRARIFLFFGGFFLMMLPTVVDMRS